MTIRTRKWSVGFSNVLWRSIYNACGQYPLFIQDTNGSNQKNPYFMGRRNWCSITLEHPSEELLFDIRVERVNGYGYTIGYRPLAIQV